ncbi:MAG: hypothetical protein JW744_01415 [Candidatus Diapherotrites archaeon]|uniref:Uncharacterized protein n=1 Tax=Candidatus Iainarchaeum sp. TaxID=3101447 RepID=A0A938YQP6_9ARCH|nr:hypothetical protein [Candidatus Diapherotrites archaeon]
MIEIKTSFNPFRMKLGRKEPVQLCIELVNKDAENTMLSMTLNLGAQFSIEKSGYKTSALERISELKPGASKKFYYEIWPKQSARPGQQPMQLTVLEHYQNFNYVKKEYKKNISLNVED